MPGTLFDAGFPASVMTFNLKNGLDIISWARRRALVADVIRSARPLLVGTQEGYARQLRYLAHQLPAYDVYGDSRHSRPEDEYNAILVDTSRVTVHNSGTRWLSPTPDVPGSRYEGDTFPRIMTWVTCTTAGYDRPLMAVNTHLTNESRWVVRQAEVVVEQIRRHAPPDIDILLTGDFNASPGSPPWHTLRSAGFADALDFAARRIGPLTTAHDWRGIGHTDSRPDSLEHRLDWIMYRPGNGATLPRDAIVETITTHVDGTYPSDHFPVVLRNGIS